MSIHLIAVDANVAGQFSQKGITKWSLPFDLYPDNTPVLNMRSGLGKVWKSQSIIGMLIKHTSYAEFVAAMNLAYTLNSGYGGRVDILYLPYVPGARQDNPRLMNTKNVDESTGDVLATLDFTFKLIADAGFRTVHVLDPHSDKMLEIAKKHKVGVKVHQPQIPLDLTVYDGIIAPDKGAGERAFRIAKENNLPLFFGSKHRDPATNALSGFSVTKLVQFGRYLVVDDICDSGGTFMGLGEAINAERARADLFVTHGLFTKGAGEKLKRYYENVYTTDSMGHIPDDVTVLEVVDRMFSNNEVQTNTIEKGER